MNITFMIGNGFDLNIGLKTRYKDFILDYLKVDTKDDICLLYTSPSPRD